MKLWKKLLLGFLALVFLFMVIGFFLPVKQHIERSIIVRGKPEEVFNLVASLKRWPDWTAWTTNRFRDMTLRFEGAESGVGALMIAAGKSSGDGTVKIVEADPTSGIAYTLDFNHGMQVFAGAIRYNNTPDGLRVTWTLDAGLGINPLKRWAGLGMGSLMGGDMERGLAKLKVQVEEKR
jgi:hypothetical protein